MPSLRRFLAVLSVVVGAVDAQYGAMALQEGLSPRFYLGNSPLPDLARRQSGVCANDEHSCAISPLPPPNLTDAHTILGLDVNASVCCPDSQYCIIDSSFSAKCCDIGSLCGNACDSSHYQCKSTATISGTATVTAACCPRSCPSISQFKCASAYGGGCCPFGYACESGNSCSATATATTSNAAVVTEVPSGCTTSQIACPTSLGGGCCAVGLSCTVVDNTNYCASASSSAMRTGPDGILASGVSETSKHSGLSTGAKAGIGAGVALGACVVLGALLWFCIVHRRRERVKSQHESSAPALSQVSGSKADTNRRGPGGRLGSDYSGPSAKPGPFAESPTSPGSSPGANRGVPLSPQNPGDITAPVEIDSRNHSNGTSPGYISMDEYMKGPSANEYAVELP
jgi:hypothetical protein